MRVAYVDTSVLVAVSFNEENSAVLATRLNTFSHLVASNLVEAELRAVFARARCRFSQDVVADIEWILPDRRLSPEIATVLEAGYVRAPTCGIWLRRSTPPEHRATWRSSRVTTGRARWRPHSDSPSERPAPRKRTV